MQWTKWFKSVLRCIDPKIQLDTQNLKEFERRLITLAEQGKLDIKFERFWMSICLERVYSVENTEPPIKIVFDKNGFVGEYIYVFVNDRDISNNNREIFDYVLVAESIKAAYNKKASELNDTNR